MPEIEQKKGYFFVQNMKNFKKAFSLMILTAFLCQNTALAAIENNLALRPPMQFSSTAKELIESLASNESFILSKLEEYYKIEGLSTGRTNKLEKDQAIVEEIRQTGKEGIEALKGILEQDKRTWVRAKAAMLLEKLYTAENKEILDLLAERLEKDESVMVRSIIARGALPGIIKNAPEITKKEIEKKIKMARLDPWPRKNCLQILDVGCQFGEASAGILEYYRKKGFSGTVVVGIDLSYPSIIEAEKNKKDPNLVFILADVDKTNIGQADIVFSMNLLLYEDEMADHAKVLAKHVNPEGGIIYYTPSVFASGQDGIMSAWKLESELRDCLPKTAAVNELRENPFGTREVFGSPWDEGAVWIKAALPEPVTIKTGKKEDVKIKISRFPDGELYLRILNPGAVEGESLTVSSALNSSEDLVRLVILLDTLKRNGAKDIKLVLDTEYKIENNLDSLLRFYCDQLFHKNSYSTVNPMKAIKKNKGPHLVTEVLYQHRRLESDAKEAARYIHAQAEQIEIVKPTDNPLTWTVNIKRDPHRENVILVHSTENAYDFAELWVMLLALRKKGVNTISLINTYKGYSRQDHAFNAGEAVSAEATVKIEDALVDNNAGLTIHYATRSGEIHKDKNDPRAWINNYSLINLNAFIQLAEFLFDRIAEWSGEGMAEELKEHPLVLVGPDNGASVYVEDAAGVLKKYIKKKYGIETPVAYGYLDKKRIGGKEVEMHGPILTADAKGQVVHLDTFSGKPVSDCWVIVLDDETSWGTTLLAATYVLVKELGVKWPRILTGAVHGKLARGLEPFKTGYTQEEITSSLKKGIYLEPKEGFVDNKKKHMPPRFFAATKSVILPKGFPEEQSVSIGPMISYTAKTFVGQRLQIDNLWENARNIALDKEVKANYTLNGVLLDPAYDKPLIKALSTLGLLKPRFKIKTTDPESRTLPLKYTRTYEFKLRNKSIDIVGFKGNYAETMPDSFLQDVAGLQPNQIAAIITTKNSSQERNLMTISGISAKLGKKIFILPLQKQSEAEQAWSRLSENKISYDFKEIKTIEDIIRAREFIQKLADGI